MKIRKIAIIGLVGLFAIAFTSCQEEEFKPSDQNRLETEKENGTGGDHDDI